METIQYLIPHAPNYIVFDTTCYEVHHFQYHILRTKQYLVSRATNELIFDIFCYLCQGCYLLFVIRLLLAIRGTIVIAYLWNFHH